MNASNARNWTVLGWSIAISATLSFAWLQLMGMSDESQRHLLRLTARVAFVVYLMAFVARPLRQIWHSDVSMWLLKHRRLTGIAFAGIHIVHLSLIVLRFTTIDGLSYPVSSALGGGLAYLMILLMLITSFDRPARALGPRNWRRLHKFGLYYIGIVFTSTLLPDSREQLFQPDYVWHVIIISVALVIRLTAYLAKRKP